MTKLNLRQHHGIVTGANTDNKAVSQNEIANGIGYKSEITSENLNAFFQRNDRALDTIVSLIMETVRSNTPNVEEHALTKAIKMHGQATYYNDSSLMTNMQVGDRFSDYLGNVYQIIAGKIIDGIVCDNAGHQIVFAGHPLPATIFKIRDYINHLPDRHDYALGYNSFARKMTGSKFKVKKVVGNKRHTTWQNLNITDSNAIEVAKHISNANLEQIMRLPIVDNNGRIQVVNQITGLDYSLQINANPMASLYPMNLYKGITVYQPTLSFQLGRDGFDVNSNDGYFNQLKVQSNNLIFSRFSEIASMPINIKKISLINL